MSIAIDVDPAPLQTDSDGVIRIGNTRVTLDTVIAAFTDGATAEGIAEQYPSVRLDEIYSTVGYYLRHKVEIESYLQERRLREEQVRHENEKRFSPTGVRARLQARRHPEE